MYSIILKITHNVRAKDSIAVVRGLYRVIQGGINHSTQAHIRKSSWMDSPQHLQAQDKISLGQEKSQPQNTHKEKFQAPNDINKKFQKSIANQQQKISPNLQAKVDKDVSSSLSDQLNKKDHKEYLKSFKQYKVQENFNPKESSIPESRFSRFYEFGKLGVSLLSTSIFSSKNKDETYYQQIAERLSEKLCKMRGAPLKLAQMLSIQQNDLISAPIRKAFEKARETAHVIPQKEVQFMLKKSYGEDWASKFLQFSEKPFASASIGQVHQAMLPNKQKVAVKIQYHAVKQSIRSDISNLYFLAKIPKLFPKSMYLERILKNTQKQLLQQCDYVREKSCQQLYEQCLRQCLDQKQRNLFKVPKIIEELSTEQILVSQYLHGIKMKNFEQITQYPQQLRNELGRRIMLLTFKELFEMGIMQSDPNPSNFTYNHEKDQLNLYDFGATHVYKPNFLKSYYQIIDGSVKQNQEQIWNSSIQTGFVSGEQNSVMKKSHIKSILITGQPLRFKGDFDFGTQQITKRIYETIPLMLKNRLKPPPEQVYSLHRKLSGSYLACIRLKAKVNCNKIFSDIKFKTLASAQRFQDRINEFEGTKKELK